MHFGSSLCGMRYFWKKNRNELIDMISQLGCQTSFFTLSVADIKCSDLHVIMLNTPPHDAKKQQKWRNQNIISNPHLASLYLHHRFRIFHEEILEKHLHEKATGMGLFSFISIKFIYIDYSFNTTFSY